MAGIIQMSDREVTRLRVMIDLADDRLTVDAAAILMGLGRRQIYRLRRVFSADGPAALASRKRGRPSNRKHGESFRATVLSLVREHYIDFGPLASYYCSATWATSRSSALSMRVCSESPTSTAGLLYPGGFLPGIELGTPSGSTRPSYHAIHRR